MGKTSISWTDRTLNWWVGCEIVSAGCVNCYAAKLAHRLESMMVQQYQGTTMKSKTGAQWTGEVNMAPESRWKEPFKVNGSQKFFVNSMSDFFHQKAKDEWRLRGLEIMRATPRHQYQVLTKRPENIAPFLKRTNAVFPDNFWLGATVEDHRVVDRIDILRDIPAKIRFLSVEPMTAHLGQVDLAGIHWVIAGSESGPRARPCKLDWVREVRDQCTDQGVAFFWKQHVVNGKKFENPELDGRQWTQFPKYL